MLSSLLPLPHVVRLLYKRDPGFTSDGGTGTEALYWKYLISFLHLESWTRYHDPSAVHKHASEHSTSLPSYVTEVTRLYLMNQASTFGCGTSGSMKYFTSNLTAEPQETLESILGLPKDRRRPTSLLKTPDKQVRRQAEWTTEQALNNLPDYIVFN